MAEDPSWKELPPGEPIPGKTYRADGWAYRDLPGWITINNWEKFTAILGAENYVVLAMSLKGDRVHAQLLISPEGMANARAYIAPRQ